MCCDGILILMLYVLRLLFVMFVYCSGKARRFFMGMIDRMRI